MDSNIILIGFMGTGKTAIGTRLADRLKREFVDTDKEIERVTGMSVRDIFLKYGEVRFRSEESVMTRKLSERRNMVVATGGGIVLNRENVEQFRKKGIIICLRANPDEIFRRVSKKRNQRPLLKKNFTVEDIKKMLADRENFYGQADIEIETSGLDPDQLVDIIMEKLQEFHSAKR
ncbi:MAG: shikimate kinase [Solirubrobacterales bacterium]